MQTNAVVKDIKLQSDTIKEFSQIVHNTLINFNVQSINNIIETMEKIIFEIIKRKSQSIKY